MLEKKTLVAEERRVTLVLIQCLEEIQSRMLYAELGYASLWEFATKYLGLSEGAAQRRIQAARLARDVPEVKASLADGTLSLSNAAKVQSFRQAEKKAGRKHDPRTLIHTVSTLTQRECEQKLFEISPQALPQERERQVSAQGEREIRIVISAELHEKLQRIRGMIAHNRPEASYTELIEMMVEETLARLERKRGFGAAQMPQSDEGPERSRGWVARPVCVKGEAGAHDADSASTAAAAVDLRNQRDLDFFTPVPAPTRPVHEPPTDGGARHAIASRSIIFNRSRIAVQTNPAICVSCVGIITNNARLRRGLQSVSANRKRHRDEGLSKRDRSERVFY